MSNLPPPYHPYGPSPHRPMPPAMQPATKRKGRGLAFAIVFALLSLCTLSAIVGAVITSSNDKPERRGAPPVPQVVADPPSESGTAKPQAAKPKAVTLEASTYRVGDKTDVGAEVIAPGLWKVSTPADGINCYWARLKNFDGELTSIRANGNVAPGKSALVTVKATDKGLELLGDCSAKVASRS
jgi:hypothetical protein